MLETWRIHDRINLYLLSAVGADRLATPLAKGKSVGDQFAHIHNVRLMWLKASAPDLLEGFSKIEKGKGTLEELTEALTHSAGAIAELVRRAETPDGRIKGFKPHAAAFIGYLISHESFHRAQVEVALRQAGTPLDDKIAYGMWEWGVR